MIALNLPIGTRVRIGEAFRARADMRTEETYNDGFAGLSGTGSTRSGSRRS